MSRIFLANDEGWWYFLTCRSAIRSGEKLNMEILSEDIRPLSDLKHKTEQLLLHLQTTRRPILFVDNGKPAAVLLGPQEFAEGMGSARLAGMLKRAENEIAEGKGRDIDEFFKEFAKTHDS